MNNNNAVCGICGRGYHRCAKCNTLPHYKNVTDTPECFKVYTVLREYRNGIISETEAIEMYERIGYDEKNLLPSVAKLIGEITEKANKQKAKSKKKRVLQESSDEAKPKTE